MSKNKPGWLEEFKAFAVKGNAMALAVGTIIGGAFSTITKSLTNDLIMPVVNIFLGGADFTEAKIALPRMPWVEPISAKPRSSCPGCLGWNPPSKPSSMPRVKKWFRKFITI